MIFELLCFFEIDSMLAYQQRFSSLTLATVQLGGDRERCEDIKIRMPC